MCHLSLRVIQASTAETAMPEAAAIAKRCRTPSASTATAAAAPPPDAIGSLLRAYNLSLYRPCRATPIIPITSAAEPESLAARHPSESARRTAGVAAGIGRTLRDPTPSLSAVVVPPFPATVRLRRDLTQSSQDWNSEKPLPSRNPMPPIIAVLPEIRSIGTTRVCVCVTWRQYQHVPETAHSNCGKCNFQSGASK